MLVELPILGVIFDVDGVLVDSKEAHFLAWSEFARQSGVAMTQEFFTSTFGMHNAQVLPLLFKRDLNESKPHPEIFLKAAAGLGLNPTNCIVIEDAIQGIEAARRAGMKCIAVTTTRKRSELTLADHIVDSLGEISTSICKRILS
jgi:beta-phosphoglucomutase-like phosphatase (HAD superfamily)